MTEIKIEAESCEVSSVKSKGFDSEYRKLANKLADEELKLSPYHRKMRLSSEEIDHGFVILDCNDILDLVGVTRSRMQHAAKKVLYAGVRGHKDLEKDLEEAIWSLQNELISIKKQKAIENEE